MPRVKNEKADRNAIRRGMVLQAREVNRMSSERMAERLNISIATYRRRMADLDSLTVRELYAMARAAGWSVEQVGKFVRGET